MSFEGAAKTFWHYKKYTTGRSRTTRCGHHGGLRKSDSCRTSFCAVG